MAKSLKTAGSSRKNICKPLSLVDVECPVCRDVFIEPVTLPCKHRFCFQCFDRTIENVSLQCPMCRTRVGGWLRTATKDNRLVDLKFWEIIQIEFSEYVTARLRGNPREIKSEVHPISVSQPGEVRREYEMQRLALEEENRKKRDAEERASADLIIKLQEEESKELAMKTMKLRKTLELDEEIARKIMLEEMNRCKVTSPCGTVKKPVQLSSEMKAGSNQPKRTENKENKAFRSCSSYVKGPLDVFLGKKKVPSNTMKLLSVGSSENVKSFPKHDKLKDGEKSRSLSSLSTGSCDSINQEMHHFKPIKVAPRTPPKQMPDGRIIEPKLVKITPVHLSPYQDDKSGRLPPQISATSAQSETQTSGCDAVPISVKTNVVRQLFSSGISPIVPSGPSAFCGTGALDSDFGVESQDSGPNEPKIPKIAQTDVGSEAGSSVRHIEEDSGLPRKSPTKRKRKRQLCEMEEPLCIEGIIKGGDMKPSDISQQILDQQYVIEAKLKQEKEDLELAQRLQREWDTQENRVDRTRGSQLEYKLRRRQPLDDKEGKGKVCDKTRSGKRKNSKLGKSPERGPRQQLLGEMISRQSKVQK